MVITVDITTGQVHRYVRMCTVPVRHSVQCMPHV